jgi:hypothetical protein
VEDELESLGGVAMVMFEKVREGLSVFEGDESQENVPGECEVEGGVGFAVAEAVLLPGAGVALVVIAVFHGPMLAGGTGGSRLLSGAQT